MNMKTVSTLLLSAALLASCSGRPVEAPTPAAQLLGRLHLLRERNMIAIGHHDDVAYGHGWEYRAGGSDVKALTGRYPLLLSWDLGLIEVDSARQLDGVPFEFIRRQAALHDARGGINTFSWHLRNPVTGGDSWDTSGGGVVARAVEPGSAVRGKMELWITRAADFIGSLRRADGSRIPVIFRPWHEHTGEWFWWGINRCSREEYIALWALTREIFDRRGIDNVVWAYSPDKSNCSTVEEYMDRYPGDERVDIMGADVYHFDGERGNAVFTERIRCVVGAAVRMAAERGKIAALTETGSESIPVDDWFTRVLYPAIRDYPIVSVTFWRNSYRMQRHFYVPYPGHPAAPDFSAFAALPRMLLLQETTHE